MPERCFIRKGSYPPLCGVHNVALLRDEVPIDAEAPHLGRIQCFLCPVTRMVLRDEVKPN